MSIGGSTTGFISQWPTISNGKCPLCGKPLWAKAACIKVGTENGWQGMRRRGRNKGAYTIRPTKRNTL